MIDYLKKEIGSTSSTGGSMMQQSSRPGSALKLNTMDPQASSQSGQSMMQGP